PDVDRDGARDADVAAARARGRGRARAVNGLRNLVAFARPFARELDLLAFERVGIRRGQLELAVAVDDREVRLAVGEAPDRGVSSVAFRVDDGVARREAGRVADLELVMLGRRIDRDDRRTADLEGDLRERRNVEIQQT